MSKTSASHPQSKSLQRDDSLFINQLQLVLMISATLLLAVILTAGIKTLVQYEQRTNVLLLTNPRSVYMGLLEKGQQFVQNSAKDSAVSAFKEAVRVQKDYQLPESDEAKRLYELYKNSADKQFTLLNDMAMYSMMDTPKHYYQLAAALKDSPEIQSEIEKCERLGKQR